MEHIAECPNDVRQRPALHEELKQFAETGRAEDTWKKSQAYHISAQSYCDINGDPLTDFWTPPTMYVLVIAPSRRHSGPGNVYERLGIGQIYLKSWVEASPVFETIILE
jgi:hypothetical protein